MSVVEKSPYSGGGLIPFVEASLFCLGEQCLSAVLGRATNGLISPLSIGTGTSPSDKHNNVDVDLSGL